MGFDTAAASVTPQRMAVRHRIPVELTGREVPAAALVDQLVAVGAGGTQRGGAVSVGREQQRDAALGRIDAVDVDLVVDGDQASVAAVESRTQVGVLVAVAGEAGTRVAERRDPSVAVARGMAPVVPRRQVQDGVAPHCPVEDELLLVGHGHLYSPCLID